MDTKLESYLEFLECLYRRIARPPGFEVLVTSLKHAPPSAFATDERLVKYAVSHCSFELRTPSEVSAFKYTFMDVVKNAAERKDELQAASNVKGSARKSSSAKPQKRGKTPARTKLTEDEKIEKMVKERSWFDQCSALQRIEDFMEEPDLPEENFEDV